MPSSKDAEAEEDDCDEELEKHELEETPFCDDSVDLSDEKPSRSKKPLKGPQVPDASRLVVVKSEPLSVHPGSQLAELAAREPVPVSQRSVLPSPPDQPSNLVYSILTK